MPRESQSDERDDMLKRVTIDDNEVLLRLPRAMAHHVAIVFHREEGRLPSDVELLMRTMDKVLLAGEVPSFPAVPATVRHLAEALGPPRQSQESLRDDLNPRLF